MESLDAAPFYSRSGVPCEIVHCDYSINKEIFLLFIYVRDQLQQY